MPGTSVFPSSETSVLGTFGVASKVPSTVSALPATLSFINSFVLSCYYKKDVNIKDIHRKAMEAVTKVPHQNDGYVSQDGGLFGFH